MRWSRKLHKSAAPLAQIAGRGKQQPGSPQQDMQPQSSPRMAGPSLTMPQPSSQQSQEFQRRQGRDSSRPKSGAATPQPQPQSSTMGSELMIVGMPGTKSPGGGIGLTGS